MVLHRWVGILLCLFFAMWFASGLVMIYVPFPSLPQSERLEAASTISISNFQNLPYAVKATGLNNIDRVRVQNYLGQPLLVVEGEGTAKAIYLNNSIPLPPLRKEDSAEVIAYYSGAAVSELNVEGPIDYDQWIVHEKFDQYRPMYRVSLNDQSKTELYVSQSTGEVLQRTTASQRAWNYFGSIPHWLYLTVIRRDWQLWDSLVWWVSLVGIIGAVSGIVLGIQRVRIMNSRSGASAFTPFKGWMKWHHVTGLGFGLFVLTWIFSGWLSMDHGRLFSEPNPTVSQLNAFRGMTLAESIDVLARSRTSLAVDAHEIEISAIHGSPIVILREPDSSRIWLVEGSSGAIEGLSLNLIEEGVARAWPEVEVRSTEVVSITDTYTNLREGSLGSEIIRTVLDDEGGTWVHIDKSTGQIVSVMDSSRRTYRWLYNGLHSLDFPGLVGHRPLWDIMMIAAMLIGFVFSVTGAILAFKRLQIELWRLRRKAIS